MAPNDQPVKCVHEHPPAPTDLPTTLGTLRASQYQPKSVREEIRANLEQRLADGLPLTSDVLGYEDTVLPQLETALLAGHDIILLGERGQAKTRMIRSLVGLLDEWLLIVAGSEIRDDPFAPISAYAIDLVAQQGEDTPVAWLHRSQRFAEKLASPDTSMADLIGEVDPIKVAGGPLPGRPEGPLLRTRAEVEPGHLCHERTARPRRTHPGGSAQRYWRSATCRSAATSCASTSTSWSSRPRTLRTTPTAVGSSRR